MTKKNRDIFLRFQNVTIPKGSIVISATCKITPSQTQSITYTPEIKVQDSDNAAAFSGSEALRNRPYAGSTSWPMGPFTIDTQITSPNFSDQVRTVVARSGWSSGNAMVIQLDSGSISKDGEQNFYSREGDATKTAEFHWSYFDAKGVIIRGSSKLRGAKVRGG